MHEDASPVEEIEIQIEESDDKTDKIEFWGLLWVLYWCFLFTFGFSNYCHT